MSDELRLPDELAACEAHLAGEPLPAVGINRDELLYRAGWVAAEAAIERRLAMPVTSKELSKQGSSRFGTTAAWSLASAVVAASLAVVVTHFAMSRPGAVLLQDDAVGSQRPSADIAAAAPLEPTRPQVARVADDPPRTNLDALIADHSRLDRRQPASPLLAQYKGPGESPWEASTIVSSNEIPSSEGPVAARTPLTARGLLNELMPVRSASNPQTPGGVLNIFRPLAWRDAI